MWRDDWRGRRPDGEGGRGEALRPSFIGACQVTAIGQPFEPVAPLIGTGGKMNTN
jgi:hypothetical protein